AASVAVRLFGERVNGAYRWIQVGGISFQAAELIKFALIIWLAGFLSDRIRTGTLSNAKATLKPLVIVLGLIGGVVAVLKSDFGCYVIRGLPATKKDTHDCRCDWYRIYYSYSASVLPT